MAPWPKRLEITTSCSKAPFSPRHQQRTKTTQGFVTLPKSTMFSATPYSFMTSFHGVPLMSTERIEIDGGEPVAFWNLTPHKMVKFPEVFAGDELDNPEFVLEPSGLVLVVKPETEAGSIEAECKCVFRRTRSSEGIPFTATPTEKLTKLALYHLAHSSHFLDVDAFLEKIRGHAVFCSAMTAAVLSNYEKYGVHCFVPTTKPQLQVRNQAGEMLGLRQLQKWPIS